MEKFGSSDFTFPIGNLGYYAPMSISGLALNTEGFRAEYFYKDPNPLFNRDSKDVLLNDISSIDYWILDRISGSTSVFVTLSWSTSRNGVVNDLNSAVVTSWNGVQWKDHGNNITQSIATSIATSNATSNGIAAPSNSGSVRTTSRVTNFGPFTVANRAPSNPLPVELLFFKAEVHQDKVELVWATASEVNSDYFLVQRSQAGVFWETIDYIECAGNSSSHLDYLSIDNSPLEGYNYYRLKQVDFDGQFEIFDPLAIYFSNTLEALLKVYPNPSTGLITLEGYLDNNNEFRMFDAGGQNVTHTLLIRELTSTSSIIDMSSLPSGLYFIRANDEAIKVFKD
jgi:hypothetical protein